MSDNLTTEQKVAAYIKMRDYCEATEAKVKEHLAPIKEAMGLLSTDLLTVMNEQGIDNIATAEGTAYRKLVSTLRITDWNATLGTIIETRDWDMLYRRIASEPAERYLEENQAPYPGTEMSRTYVVQVRRKS